MHMKTQQQHKQELFNFLADQFGVATLDRELEHIIKLCAPVTAQRLLKENSSPDGELIYTSDLKDAVKKLAER